jgi:formate hydrogenlyase transcriptional activator
MTDADALIAAHLSRYDALQRISKTLAGHRTMAGLFQVLAGELHSLVPFDYLALLLHDEAANEMRIVVVEPDNLTPPFASVPVSEESPSARVWQTQKGLVIPIPDEGPLPQGLAFIRSQGRKMTCWLPLTTAYRRVGVLSFGSRFDAAYSDDVLEFMEQVASTVAIAVDNGINYDRAQAYQRELEDERDHLRFLLDVNNLLVPHHDFPTLLKAISEAVQRVITHDQVIVGLYDHDSNRLRLDWTYDGAHGLTQCDITLPLDRSVAGIVFERGAAGVFRRPEAEALGPDCVPMMKASGIESACCVPLVTRNGGRLGVLCLGSANGDAFSDQDVTFLEQTSAQIAIAVENATAYEAVTSLNARLADEKQYLERELQQEFVEIVGRSPALRRVLKAVKTVAPTDSTVLLLGETGTGKELIARAVHALSPRRERTFVRMSIAALPSGLIEAELFGYERGAFTGAATSRTGRLELANRGTLFLDEVGDIPADIQPKLLRVLQEREFERLGSTRTQRVDVRVVAATNRDLESLVEEGSFRSDLYYRLNVFPIVLPPLRDRVEDIPALALHFAQQCARRMGRPAPSIPDTVMSALVRWNWPGNIRELQNVIERAVILSSGTSLVLPLEALPVRASRRSSPAPARTFSDAERDTILRALRESGGVVAGPAGAAARLGLRRTTLQSKMRRLKIRRPSY